MFVINAHSKRVSLLKGITWRIVGTIDTIFLSWIFTGSIDKALKIGGIELFTKIILYFLHDRAWNYFKIGRKEVQYHEGRFNYEDKHWRSFIKGMSWRFFGTIDTVIIAFFVTGNITRAFEIGFTEVFTKLTLFYIHERIWMRITRPHSLSIQYPEPVPVKISED